MNNRDDITRCSRRRFMRRMGGLGLAAGAAAGCDPASFAKYALTDDAEKVDDRYNESMAGHAKALTTLPTPASDIYSFLWASDIHVADGRSDHVDKLGAYASLVNAVFLLHSGDCADGGTRADYDKWVNVMHDYLPVPYFSAIGNHDLYGGGWPFFSRFIGPSVFRFTYGYCDFIFLDTAGGTLGHDQMHWFEKVMDRGSGYPLRFVLSHYPIYDGGLQTPSSMGNTEERMKLVSLMGDNNVSYFLCGHKHCVDHYNIRGFEHLISGCGSAYKELLNDDYHFWRFDVQGAYVSKEKIYYRDVEL
jgi:3',5'-cyclic AMP phosphodiesterase CpdA